MVMIVEKREVLGTLIGSLHEESGRRDMAVVTLNLTGIPGCDSGHKISTCFD